MWYINGRVESLPLTDMRYINGWVESLVLRRKARDFFPYSHREDGTNEENSRGIRQAIDHIIIVLRIMLQEFIG